MTELIYGLGKAMWIGLVSIPGSFWGVLIGSGVSVLTVYLTNKAHDQRLKTQLAHDRGLKNRDREMALRKDIYLAAAEAIHACMTLINRMPQLEISLEKLTEDYMAKSSSMAKVHIVAKEVTIKSVLDFSCEVAATLPRLSTKRQPLVNQMNEIAKVSELKMKYVDFQSRMTELISQHMLEGSTAQDKLAILKSNVLWANQRINECSEQETNLASLLYSERLQFMGECSKEVMRLWHLSVPVVTAVRQELDIPLNESGYGSLVEGAIVRMKQVMDDITKQKPGPDEAPPTTA